MTKKSRLVEREDQTARIKYSGDFLRLSLSKISPAALSYILVSSLKVILFKWS